VSPLVTQISWTNHLLIISKTKTIEEKEFYINLCLKEKYSKRELERQINSAYFERYMLSLQKISPAIQSFNKQTSNTFLDKYSLEFLNLPENVSEFDLRKAIIKI
jgi:predicted nuclease of restriction endonuclease-like (RecB) superfamily